MSRKKFSRSVRKFVRKEKARLRRQFGRDSSDAKTGIQDMVQALMQKHGVTLKRVTPKE